MQRRSSVHTPHGSACEAHSPCLRLKQRLKLILIWQQSSTRLRICSTAERRQGIASSIERRALVDMRNTSIQPQATMCSRRYACKSDHAVGTDAGTALTSM